MTPASADGPDVHQDWGNAEPPGVAPVAGRHEVDDDDGVAHHDLRGHADVDDIGQEGVVQLAERVAGRRQARRADSGASDREASRDRGP